MKFSHDDFELIKPPNEIIGIDWGEIAHLKWKTVEKITV